MKKFTIHFLTVVFALSLGSQCWAISWESDLASALIKAKTEGKPVMADFYTDWCHWCTKLDQDVYTDAAVNRFSEKFICVKVNCEQDKSAFSKYKLQGYPTIIFFSPDGNAQETVVGYKTAKVFADTMNKVLNKQPKPLAVQEPQAAAPVVKEKRVAGEFKLSGIMLPKAIVNDKIVNVGDEVDGAKVVAITADSVKLLYNGKELTLNI